MCPTVVIPFKWSVICETKLYTIIDAFSPSRVKEKKQDREVEQNSETTSQFGLQAATRLHEVGIASNRGSACHGEYVPGPCTHRPSHHESRGDPKSVV